MHPASWCSKKAEEKVCCTLCPHTCLIATGARGKCRVRINDGGSLYAENYGQYTGMHVDPIEKKPLYHFYPGRQILSIGSFGCNLHCGFCQNWQIAHKMNEGIVISAEEVAALAQQHENSNQSIGVAYTYSEPGVWYEFVKETTVKVRQRGLKNVLVTNGYLNKNPFLSLIEDVDALNIDVKAFNEAFYRDVVKGELTPVLSNCSLAKERGKHLEITTLLVPGYNDDIKEIHGLAKWIAAIDRNIPLHLSRYFPCYQMTVPPISLERLLLVVETAKEHLNYVYAGNAPELGISTTRCQSCGSPLIDRYGYKTVLHMENGLCSRCKAPVRTVIM